MNGHLLSYYALIEAEKARIEAMKIENSIRSRHREAPAYGEDAFNAACDELTRIAIELRNIS